MKVTKAIFILSARAKDTRPDFDPDMREALNLGVEALKRHRNRDYLTYNEVHQGLPGETPEEEV